MPVEAGTIREREMILLIDGIGTSSKSWSD